MSDKFVLMQTLTLSFDLLETSLKFLSFIVRILSDLQRLGNRQAGYPPVYQAGFSRSTAIHPAMAFVAPAD